MIKIVTKYGTFESLEDLHEYMKSFRIDYIGMRLVEGNKTTVLNWVTYGFISKLLANHYQVQTNA